MQALHHGDRAVVAAGAGDADVLAQTRPGAGDLLPEVRVVGDLAVGDHPRRPTAGHAGQLDVARQRRHADRPSLGVDEVRHLLLGGAGGLRRGSDGEDQDEGGDQECEEGEPCGCAAAGHLRCSLSD